MSPVPGLVSRGRGSCYLPDPFIPDAARNRFRHLSLRPETLITKGVWQFQQVKNVDNITRKPTLLFLLSGLFLLRQEQRAFL
ncbi:MAG: hypothetical protein NG747_04885 [Candidatus Brocadia sp.]|nr:hypothetical protein [Candidatus Brocadia sp.]